MIVRNRVKHEMMSPDTHYTMYDSFTYIQRVCEWWHNHSNRCYAAILEATVLRPGACVCIFSQMARSRVSQYFEGLSPEAQQRYRTKLTATGLLIDPYAIPTSEWTQEPDVIPKVQWSD